MSAEQYGRMKITATYEHQYQHSAYQAAHYPAGMPYGPPPGMHPGMTWGMPQGYYPPHYGMPPMMMPYGYPQYGGYPPYYYPQHPGPAHGHYAPYSYHPGAAYQHPPHEAHKFPTNPDDSVTKPREYASGPGNHEVPTRPTANPVSISSVEQRVIPQSSVSPMRHSPHAHTDSASKVRQSAQQPPSRQDYQIFTPRGD